MDIKIIRKESFVVIGKEGSGPSVDAYQWIAPLWEQANKGFMEIINFAKHEQDGTFSFWGVMSDVGHHFRPWTDQGLYLAGCEVLDIAIPPLGWTKWVVPTFDYVVVSCTMDTYGQVMSEVLNQYFKEHNYRLTGAIHEHYSLKYVNGVFDLYFPFEKV